MTCEAYDHNGDICRQAAHRTIEIGWKDLNIERAFIQARMCQAHYQTFNAVMTGNHNMTVTEGE